MNRWISESGLLNERTLDKQLIYSINCICWGPTTPAPIYKLPLSHTDRHNGSLKNNKANVTKMLVMHDNLIVKRWPSWMKSYTFRNSCFYIQTTTYTLWPKSGCCGAVCLSGPKEMLMMGSNGLKGTANAYCFSEPELLLPWHGLWSLLQHYHLIATQEADKHLLTSLSYMF